MKYYTSTTEYNCGFKPFGSCLGSAATLCNLEPQRDELCESPFNEISASCNSALRNDRFMGRGEKDLPEAKATRPTERERGSPSICTPARAISASWIIALETQRQRLTRTIPSHDYGLTAGSFWTAPDLWSPGLEGLPRSQVIRLDFAQSGRRPSALSRCLTSSSDTRGSSRRSAITAKSWRSSIKASYSSTGRTTATFSPLLSVKDCVPALMAAV